MARRTEQISLLCFLLTVTLPPINLLCVRVCVCVCVKRWQKTDGMSSYPPLLSVPLTFFNEPHSPEKFLETSMVVRMAPCGGRGGDEGKDSEGVVSDMNLLYVKGKVWTFKWGYTGYLSILSILIYVSQHILSLEKQAGVQLFL